MRVLALGLAFLVAIPIAVAETQLLEDSKGDATYTATGGASVPLDASNSDLIALFIDEDTDGFAFRLEMASLDPPDSDASYRQFDVDFLHLDQGYRVRYVASSFGPSGVSYFAQLMSFDPGRGQYVVSDNLPLDVLDDTNLRAYVERNQLIDTNGTAPTAGRSLTQFRAASYEHNTFVGWTGQVRGRDAMPDDGFGPIDYAVEQGLAQTGEVRLSSAQPVRASNGEKAVFVFYVTASNMRGEEQRYEFDTVQVPDGWEITLPSTSLRLEANRSRTFPVLVSTPFNHLHGAFEHFVLELHGTKHAVDEGRLQLGIRYLDVPQPAGHHDRLHIHARSQAQGFFDDTFDSSRTLPYMNTLEDDDNDEELPIPPTGGGGGLNGHYIWDVYLEPGLEMGLDFDINRTGSLSTVIGSDLGLTGAVVSGGLYHLAGTPDEDGDLEFRDTLLASIVPSTPQSIGASTTVETILQPTPESDRIPYQRHQALLLRIVLDSESASPPGISGAQPTLRAGEMQLPLNEYRDSIEGVFNSLAGLSFRHESPPEKSVNPGETRLFNLTLRNEGAVDDTFTLRVNGTNEAWARILGDDTIFVTTGTERAVVVAVTAPDDAPDGDTVDLIVSAVSAAEPDIQGNIRVVAVVDAILDHPDESGLVLDAEDRLTGKKKSPGAGILLVAAGLLVAWQRRNGST